MAAISFLCAGLFFCPLTARDRFTGQLAQHLSGNLARYGKEGM